MTGIDYGRAYQASFATTIQFLMSRGLSPAAAEETAQAAWTRGWERIGQLRNKELLATWVNSIAFNLYRRHARYAKRFRPLGESGAEAGRDVECRHSFIDLAAIDLGRVLQECSPSDRRLLRLQLHGLTAVEIAEHIRTTETAARIRMMRARRSARSIVSAHAMSPSGPSPLSRGRRGA
ncbi:MAG TPA: hypothetical protein VG273_01240 [Bryobacteraceae bacterium]|jgi:DNA-directed RNA polymerase specialized sigma24 family protein|nr:hypothetical protein [Bryobacteraceae bacterium]